MTITSSYRTYNYDVSYNIVSYSALPEKAPPVQPPTPPCDLFAKSHWRRKAEPQQGIQP